MKEYRAIRHCRGLFPAARRGVLIMGKMSRAFSMMSCFIITAESFKIALFSIDKDLFFVCLKLSWDYFACRTHNEAQRGIIRKRRSIRRSSFYACLLFKSGIWYPRYVIFREGLFSRFYRHVKVSHRLVHSWFMNDGEKFHWNLTHSVLTGNVLLTANCVTLQKILEIRSEARQQPNLIADIHVERKKIAPRTFEFCRKWKFSVLFISNSFCISRSPIFSFVSFVHNHQFPSRIDG